MHEYRPYWCKVANRYSMMAWMCIKVGIWNALRPCNVSKECMLFFAFCQLSCWVLPWHKTCVMSFVHCTGRKQFKPKGRGKRYTTQEEARDQEEKKRREKEWKVRVTLFQSRGLTFFFLMLLIVYLLVVVGVVIGRMRIDFPRGLLSACILLHCSVNKASQYQTVRRSQMKRQLVSPVEHLVNCLHHLVMNTVVERRYCVAQWDRYMCSNTTVCP